MDLPYLTSDLPGTGGQAKQRVEDFHVEELPLYEACGEGTHVYFRVRKRGVPTPAAIPGPRPRPSSRSSMAR